MAYQSNESGKFEVYVRPFPNVDDKSISVDLRGKGILMARYIQQKVDFIAPNFDPQSGHEKKRCRPALVFRNVMNGKPESWDALGEEYHKRLERNYVTWVRRYLCQGSQLSTVEQLRGRNISWTVGALSETGSTIRNIQAAGAAGIVAWPYATFWRKAAVLRPASRRAVRRIGNESPVHGWCAGTLGCRSHVLFTGVHAPMPHPVRRNPFRTARLFYDGG
jgi:hypothetical protein